MPDRRLWLAAPLLALAASALAQDAVLTQKSALLATPAPGAKAVAKLEANAPLGILERKGGWYRVKGPGGEEGWVRLLSVRLTSRPGAEESGADSGNAAQGALGGAASGNAGAVAAGALGSMMTGSSADSTAVRGGSSGKLSGKKLVDPATAEAGAGSSLEQVDGFAPSDDDMKSFEEGLDDEGAPQ
jgi:hypothetical protein